MSFDDEPKHNELSSSPTNKQMNQPDGAEEEVLEEVMSLEDDNSDMSSVQSLGSESSSPMPIPRKRKSTHKISDKPNDEDGYEAKKQKRIERTIYLQATKPARGKRKERDKKQKRIIKHKDQNYTTPDEIRIMAERTMGDDLRDIVNNPPWGNGKKYEGSNEYFQMVSSICDVNLSCNWLLLHSLSYHSYDQNDSRFRGLLKMERSQLGNLNIQESTFMIT